MVQLVIRFSCGHIVVCISLTRKIARPHRLAQEGKTDAALPAEKTDHQRAARRFIQHLMDQISGGIRERRAEARDGLPGLGGIDLNPFAPISTRMDTCLQLQELGLVVCGHH